MKKLRAWKIFRLKALSSQTLAKILEKKCESWTTVQQWSKSSRSRIAWSYLKLAWKISGLAFVNSDKKKLWQWFNTDQSPRRVEALWRTDVFNFEQIFKSTTCEDKVEPTQDIFLEILNCSKMSSKGSLRGMKILIRRNNQIDNKLGEAWTNSNQHIEI